MIGRTESAEPERLQRLAAEPRVGAPAQRGQADERENGDADEEFHRCHLIPLVQWTRPIHYLDYSTMSMGQLSRSDDERSADDDRVIATAGDVDVERDSDVPISTQIYWQLAYQIDSGRLLPGARLAPVREMGAALRVNPNTIRAVYRRLADAGYVSSRHGAGTHVSD